MHGSRVGRSGPDGVAAGADGSYGGGVLTPEQAERYRRTTDLAGFGEAAQERLLAARVVVVGAGGLGSAALPYLAAAGVGRLTVADGDVVTVGNLQRQVLHVDVGRNKAESAADRLRRLNPGCDVTPVPEMLDADRVAALAADHDLLLDCCDTFAAKLVLSDAARAAGRPLVWAAAVGTYGQCSVFGVPAPDGRTLWLRDLFPVEPDDHPRAADVGVLGPMVGQLGALQASEAVKVLTGWGRPLAGRVLVLDALTARWDVVDVRSRP